MMFAVDEINESNHLLPNVSLGYNILDSCSSPINVLRAVLMLVSSSEEKEAGTSQCRPPPILAVVAEAGSSQSLAVAGALGPFRIPTVIKCNQMKKNSNNNVYNNYIIMLCLNR